MLQCQRSYLAMLKTQEMWVQSLGQDDPLKKEMATHSSILAGKFHEQRNLVGYSPWGYKESDITKQLNTHPHTQNLFKIKYTHLKCTI